VKKISALSASVGALMLSSMACRPVIAIGWTELAIIIGIIFLLFAPFLLRLFRFFTRNQDAPEKHSDEPDR
jgi:1,4-dihydroxy-2-naphthoate octaprenyltransferase